MKFIIREMSWYKRRTPVPEPKPVSVVVEGIKLERNHSGVMYATYDDGNVYELSAHVSLNEIKNTWTVQGLDHMGHSVLCDIEEEI